jgi:hypothetical protein
MTFPFCSAAQFLLEPRIQIEGTGSAVLAGIMNDG